MYHTCKSMTLSGVNKEDPARLTYNLRYQFKCPQIKILDILIITFHYKYKYCHQSVLLFILALVLLYDDNNDGIKLSC